MLRAPLADITQAARSSRSACPSAATSSAPPSRGSDAAHGGGGGGGAVPGSGRSMSVMAAPMHGEADGPEYSEEVLLHLLRRERAVPRPGAYLAGQPEITERMRTILIDWLIDVHLKFKLHPETYFLAVDIVDRYLARTRVSRSELQLVGITAVLVAAKHEEIWPPEINDCVYISANTYSAPEVLAMERNVCSALHFRFTVATVYPFACRVLEGLAEPLANSAAAGPSVQPLRDATFFFLECAAHEIRFVSLLPSRVAFAAVLLARLTLAHNAALQQQQQQQQHAAPSAEALWDEDVHVQLATAQAATFEEIAPVAQLLLQAAAALTAASSRLQAVRRKYMAPRFGAVASLALPPFVVQAPAAAAAAITAAAAAAAA